jgi:hypothetical protein
MWPAKAEHNAPVRNELKNTFSFAVGRSPDGGYITHKGRPEFCEPRTIVGCYVLFVEENSNF